MGSVFGGKKKSKSKSFSSNDTNYNSESTQSLAPWGNTQAGLETASGMAADFLSNPMQFYPGQTFLDNNQGQLGALNSLVGQAGDNSQIADTGLGIWNSFAQGPEQGAWDDRLLDYSNRVSRDLDRNIIPGINDNAVMSGGRRSSRAGVAEGLARGEAGRDIMEYNNKLALDFENLRSKEQQAAMAMTPNMMNTMMLPQNQMLQGLTALRGDEQNQLNEDMRRYTFDQQQERGNLATMQNMLMGPATAFGETTGITSGKESSKGASSTTTKESGGGGLFNKILGGGMAAAGFMTGNPTMGFGGIGMMGGSGMTGLGGTAGAGVTGLGRSGGIGYDPFMSNPYAGAMNPYGINANMINPQFQSMQGY